MKTGIYGGTFNPPHIGHLLTARRAAEQLSLERVIIVPTATPPHKSELSLATESDRLQMCRLLFCDPLFTVSDIELQRSGKSYTVETLEAFRRLYPEDEFYLIIGSDMLFCFDKWVRYRDILQLCCLFAFSRDKNVDEKTMYQYATQVLKLPEGSFILSQQEPYELSSTCVREQLHAGERIEQLVGQQVAAFIAERKVYTPDTDRNEEFDALIRQMLKPERYRHSLGVAKSAAHLAKRYGADEKKAYTAGLLHDIAKYLPAEEHQRLANLTGDGFTGEELANPSLWHAISGAAYAAYELHVKDRDIIRAIRYHTTGRKGMSLFEKIIYIADFISEDRCYPDVEVMRTLADKSLEDAALYALKYCIGNLAKTGKIIHADSVEFYNELTMSQTADKS